MSERKETITLSGGILLFSKENAMVCFLAVYPSYRRQHIAEKMLSHIRRPDFYKPFGFAERKLTEEWLILMLILWL